MEQSLSIQKIDQILQSYPDLGYKDKQTLKIFLCKAKLLKALIRQNIIEQGAKSKKGIMLIEGTVIITKKIATGKMIFSQLTAIQVVNLQALMYQRAYYTITVQSSQVKYVQLSENINNMLFLNMKEMVQQREKKRNIQIQLKLNQMMKKQQKKEKEKMINQLSLPALKYFSKPNKQVNSTESPIRRSLTKTNSNNLQKSTQLSPKKRSQSMTKILGKRNFDLKEIKINRKVQKSQNQKNSPSKDRNEKIFKQQLKQIIKRKLIYQRKQLGVLKAYRHKNNFQDNKVIYLQNAKNLETQKNQIDQYFKA